MTDETKWMKQLRALLHGAEPPPIARTIGFVLESVEPGAAVFSLTGDPARHANPMGTMHGGVLVPRRRRDFPHRRAQGQLLQAGVDRPPARRGAPY